MADTDFPSLSPRQLGWAIISEQACAMSYKDAILLCKGPANAVAFPTPVVANPSIRACDTIIQTTKSHAPKEPELKTFSDDSIAVEDALVKSSEGDWKKSACKSKKQKKARR